MVKGTVWTHGWPWELHRNDVATLFSVVTNWGYGNNKGILKGFTKAGSGYNHKSIFDKYLMGVDNMDKTNSLLSLTRNSILPTTVA